MKFADMSKEQTAWRARVAGLARDRQPDDPELIAARQNHKTARLADFIRVALAGAPPLTKRQRTDLARLLRDDAPRRVNTEASALRHHRLTPQPLN